MDATTVDPDTSGTPAGPGDPPGRWGQLVILAVAMVLAMTTWFSATAVIGRLRVDWGLSSGASSWLTIAVQLGFVAGAVLSAATNLADLVAPRRLILAGAVLAAAANGALVAATGPEVGIPLRFLTGMALAAVYPPALKAMSTWFREGRGLALGVMVGALTLGSAVPHLVRAAVAVEWRTVIVATSLLTLAGGALAELAGRDGPFPFPSARFDPRQTVRVLRNRGVRLASVGYFGHMWELYAMWAWVGAFAADAWGRSGAADPTRAGALVAFGAIAVGAVGCVGAGALSDRWGRTAVTSAAMAVSGSMALTVGWLIDAPRWLVLGALAVWGLTVVADSAQFSTMVTETAEQAYVGTAVTLQLAAGFVLTVVTIWLVPLLRDAHGWGWAFGLLAPGPAVGIAAMIRLRGAPEAAAMAGGRR